MPETPSSTPEISPEAVDEISLIDIISVLWKKRLMIIVLTGICACVIGMIVGPKVFFSQESITKLKFQLDFQGADKEEYPNGIPFTTADITSPLIVVEVFEKNKFEKYMNQVEFRDSISVQKSTDGLKFLEDTYRALLSDRKLSAEERQSLQREYRSQKTKLLDHTEYYLTFNDVNNKVPAEIQAKALIDILQAWAEFTQQKRGVYLYEIAMLSPEALDTDLTGEEYVTQADMLRLMGQRISKSVESIAELPGAMQVRTSDGMTLTSLQVKVEDLRRFKIVPLSGMVKRGRLYKNENLATDFLNEQIHKLELAIVAQSETIELMRDTLDGDVSQPGGSGESTSKAGGNVIGANTLIPQIDAAFLDRVISMANKSEDLEYRQEVMGKIIEEGRKLFEMKAEIAYYKDLLPESQENGVASGADKELRESFEKKCSSAMQEAKQLTVEMNRLYTVIGANNLQPELGFYSGGTLPEYEKLYTQPLKKVILICAGVVFLFFCMVCLLLIVQDQLKQKG